jgi:hypothetical protein
MKRRGYVGSDGKSVTAMFNTMFYYIGFPKTIILKLQNFIILIINPS